MTRKAVWLAVSLVMVAALVLASCGEPTEDQTTPKTEPSPVEFAEDSLGILKEKPRYGGVARFSWTGSGLVGSWDPGAPTAGRTWHLGMYQSLTRADFTVGPSGTGEFGFQGGFFPEAFRVGALAESWETPDMSTIIMHLRQGVYYHDKPPVNGREMVAADVVAAFKRHQEMPRSYWYRPPDTPEEELFRASEIDRYTVQVLLPKEDTRPWADINWLVYPPELVPEDGGEITNWKEANGTGPFICTDYVPDSSFTYVRNDNYWDVDPFFPENKVPYIDGYTNIMIPDYNSALAALRTAKIDWLTAVNLEDAESLWTSNPELLWGRGLNYYAPVIEMRNDLEPFSDIRVRRALMLAVDQEAIAEDYYEGRALVYHWPFRPELSNIYTPWEELSDEAKMVYQYDPEKARELLADAGYPNGMKVELLVSFSTSEHADLADIVKFYWDAVGVETTVNVLEIGTFYGRMYGWKYENTGLVHWSNVSPFLMTDVAYHTDRLYNYSKVSDPFIDDLSDTLMKTADPADRDAMFKDLGPYILEHAFNLPLPLSYNYVFWQPWMKGYSGEWWGGFSYRWLDLDLRKTMTGE